MFERYTENARRAVFFARYEAVQHGSPYIETEHLLLGLLREDLAVRNLLKQTAEDWQIRNVIEQTLSRRQRIPESVEVPLSADSKKALLLAAEEADRLEHRWIGTEHMLLGLLRVENSRAAQIVMTKGVTARHVRSVIAKGPPTTIRQLPLRPALTFLQDFLNGLKRHQSGALVSFFAGHVSAVDAFGKLWNHEEITNNFEGLFAPYAKKNATYVIEETVVGSIDQAVFVVL
jgi:hypothetical protein